MRINQLMYAIAVLLLTAVGAGGLAQLNLEVFDNGLVHLACTTAAAAICLIRATQAQQSEFARFLWGTATVVLAINVVIVGARLPELHGYVERAHDKVRQLMPK